MAPEQLRGQPVDPRADQFSFCVALYEALYGERPFAGENFPQLRTAVLAGTCARPAGQRRTAPLRAALLRGLSVDRARRWPDMDALVNALEAASVGGSHMAPLLAGAGAAAVLVLAGGLMWQLRAPRPATRATKRRRSWRSRGRSARTPRGAPTYARPFSRDRARCARTARPHQPGADTYAAAWLNVHRAGCEAQARSEPPALRTLRQRCLDQRAEELGALVDVLAHADAKIVRKSIAAALALPPLDTCADAATLKTVAAPPDNPAIAGRVQQLRRRLAALRALAAAGHDWQAMKPLATLVEEARITGDEGLLADALLVYARTRSPFDPEAAVGLPGRVQARRIPAQQRAGGGGSHPARGNRGRDPAPLQRRRALGAPGRRNPGARPRSAAARLVPAQPRHPARRPRTMAAGGGRLHCRCRAPAAGHGLRATRAGDVDGSPGARRADTGRAAAGGGHGGACARRGGCHLPRRLLRVRRPPG